ncbi:hypothetical protein HPB48_024309 [Haemaphysalis longicornis]|uniref:Gag-like protein n=1 Tax=Haemaphysalis longicornis TaxID=44386 RepID=A0A9J6H687_HAELO|nr:hypothetical protein HPB48_024309 [Haemaphysalis longicornis]
MATSIPPPTPRSQPVRTPIRTISPCYLLAIESGMRALSSMKRAAAQASEGGGETTQDSVSPSSSSSATSSSSSETNSSSGECSPPVSPPQRPSRSTLDRERFRTRGHSADSPLQRIAFCRSAWLKHRASATVALPKRPAATQEAPPTPRSLAYEKACDGDAFLHPQKSAVQPQDESEIILPLKRPEGPGHLFSGLPPPAVGGASPGTDDPSGSRGDEAEGVPLAAAADREAAANSTSGRLQETTHAAPASENTCHPPPAETSQTARDPPNATCGSSSPANSTSRKSADDVVSERHPPPSKTQQAARSPPSAVPSSSSPAGSSEGRESPDRPDADDAAGADDEGFTLVRHGKRRPKKTSPPAPSPPLSQATPPRAGGKQTDSRRASAAGRLAPQVTVLFKPNTQGASLRQLSRYDLSEELKHLRGLGEIRINARLNLVAIDTVRDDTRDVLLGLRSLGGVPVQPYPASKEGRTRAVLRGIDAAGGAEELIARIKTPVPIIGGSRKGQLLFLTFLGRQPPTHVFLSHIRVPVELLTARNLQCGHCYHFGHVRTACRGAARCARLRGPRAPLLQVRGDPLGNSYKMSRAPDRNAPPVTGATILRQPAASASPLGRTTG